MVGNFPARAAGSLEIAKKEGIERLDVVDALDRHCGAVLERLEGLSAIMDCRGIVDYRGIEQSVVTC